MAKQALNRKIVFEKTNEVNRIIEGITVSEVLAVLSSVIMNIVLVAQDDKAGYLIQFLRDWLRTMIRTIDNVEIVEDVEEEMVN